MLIVFWGLILGILVSAAIRAHLFSGLESWVNRIIDAIASAVA